MSPEIAEVPYSLSPMVVCRAWGPGTHPSLCLLHKAAAVWARLEVAPLASRQREGHCLVPASLLETASAPKPHQGRHQNCRILHRAVVDR